MSKITNYQDRREIKENLSGCLNDDYGNIILQLCTDNYKTGENIKKNFKWVHLLQRLFQYYFKLLLPKNKNIK